jgi:hypothetical protein
MGGAFLSSNRSGSHPGALLADLIDRYQFAATWSAMPTWLR